MTALDDLLEKHSLTRADTTAYIDAIIRMNQSEAAEEIGVTRPTIHRYKNAFREMDAETRAFIIASLFDERHRELTRDSEG